MKILNTPEAIRRFKLFKIIKKKHIPSRQKWGKWQELISNLADNKAVKIDFNDAKDAEKARSSIHGCFRTSRAKLNGHKVKTRLVRMSGNEISLYVWQE